MSLRTLITLLESKGRVGTPGHNNVMGYSYRCRIVHWRTWPRKRERWGFIVQRFFMDWQDEYGTKGRFKSRQEAEQAANRYLDAKEWEPKAADFVEGGTDAP